MSQIDMKVFAVIMAGTTFVVGVIKKLAPKLVDGKEELWSVALPILGVASAKLSHQFQDTSWIDALLWALGAGVGSGVVHDKVLNPLLGKHRNRYGSGLLVGKAGDLARKEDVQGDVKS